MKRILLIEDNHSLREEIVNILELEGFDEHAVMRVMRDNARELLGL